MRTVAQETAPQVALRDCSKEVGGNVNIYDLGEGRGGSVQSSLCFTKGFLLVTRN